MALALRERVELHVFKSFTHKGSNLRIKKHFVALLALLLCALSSPTKAAPLKTEGALSPQEKQHFIEWAVKAKSPADNWDNYWVLRYFYVDTMYWVYSMSGDKRIVDNLMVMAEKAVDRNNKRYKQRLIHVSWDPKTQKPIGEVLPSWPHKSDFGPNADGDLVNQGDAGEVTVGAIYLSIAARTIIETPGLWQQVVPGKPYTYLERARFYIDESIDVIERSFKRMYVDPVTLEQQYQLDFPPPPTEKWRARGVYVPFNRVWHAQTLFTHLNPCLEQLGIHLDKVAEYDRISEVAMNTWINKSMRRYTENGIKLLDFPYRYSPDPHEKTNSEDVGHSAYDVFEIGSIYRSGRYPMVNEDILERWANTIVHKVYKGNDEYSYRLDGTGDARWKNKNASGKARTFYYQFKRFNPQLVDHIKPSGSGSNDYVLLFARAFEEIQVDCMVGSKAITTKSIAIQKGQSLQLTTSFPEDDRHWHWVDPSGQKHAGKTITLESTNQSDAGTYIVAHHPPNGIQRANFVKVTVYERK